MANKLGPSSSPGVARTGLKVGELPDSVQHDLAQTLLTVLRSISINANESEEDLPAEAIDAIARFHRISCALATVSDRFICAAPPPPPQVEG